MKQLRTPAIVLTFIILAFTAYSASTHSRTARKITLLDDGWSFTFQPDPASGLEPFTKNIDLPHDWSVSLPFDRNTPAGNDGGYLPTGKGIYKKTIEIPGNTVNRKYSLNFEGVYERWTLILNGDTIGFRPYGYSSVIYDITPSLKNGPNEIEIIVDNSNQKNCRWYSGSGIYRHVWLTEHNATAIKPWSLFITTPEVDRTNAEIRIQYDIDGISDSGKLSSTIVVTDPEGKEIKSVTSDIPALQSHISETINIEEPALWSPDSPSLYTVFLTLSDEGKTVDEIAQPFGIRSVSFSANEGMKLNGEPIELNGACVHHDNGILGAASYDAAEARKVRLLKSAGFNAVRTSHNPPSPAFLDECDRQGLLVIDEAFDGWRDAKNDNDYSIFFDQWATTDVGDMVRRDRNHPSIIAWSIGNEVIERKKIEIITTARRLAAECRKQDPTRPVTQALCAWDSDWEIYDPLAEALDIVGYNYMIHKSESDHDRCPERVMWQTESYPADAASNMHKVKENPYIIGDFVWTGIDYLGESGIGRYFYEGQTPGEHYERPQWPWHGAYCGDIDLTGWRKPVSHYRDMLYNDKNKLYMAVREPDGYNGTIHRTLWSVWPTWESWNWPGHEGKDIEIEVVTRYPKVQLYVNDILAGEHDMKPGDDYRTVFTTSYSPGSIWAVGLDTDGRVMESRTIKTSGKPHALRLTPDKTTLRSDNQDISFIVAEVVDKEGNPVPDAEIPVVFSVSANATIVGSGSADLTSLEPYSSPETTTWKGRAIVAVKSGHKPGNIVLTAASPALQKATVRLHASK